MDDKREERSAPLPHDLTVEILVRLPVKSLVRFKAVSKSWNALIRSPNFVNQHTKHDRGENALLLSCRLLHPHTTSEERGDFVLSLHGLVEDSSQFLPVPLVGGSDHCLDMLGPCNGLFFLLYQNISMLCNPALREFRALPPRAVSSVYPRECYRVSHLGDGFGFDPVTRSYKVVSMHQVASKNRSDGSSLVKIELYDSRSDCWRIIESANEMLSNVSNSFGVFFRGACHWEANPAGLFEPAVVLTFDVSSEVVAHFEFPKWKDEKDCCLLALRDRLTLVRYPSLSQSSSSIDIWVMEEYGVKESWAQALRIEQNSLNRVSYVFGFWKDERALVETCEGEAASLDLRSGELGWAFTLCGLPFQWNAVVFKESLVSLDEVIHNGANARDG